MKIPQDAVIASDKLTKYLLVPQRKSDKSKFLARAGFTLENPSALEAAIRQVILENEAVLDLTNQFGDYYRVEGDLVGVNGIHLGVVTIWIIRTDEDNVYRFVTLKPRE